MFKNFTIRFEAVYFFVLYLAWFPSNELCYHISLTYIKAICFLVSHIGTNCMRYDSTTHTDYRGKTR
jgi:hypothetical protein